MPQCQATIALKPLRPTQTKIVKGLAPRAVPPPLRATPKREKGTKKTASPKGQPLSKFCLFSVAYKIRLPSLKTNSSMFVSVSTPSEPLLAVTVVVLPDVVIV